MATAQCKILPYITVSLFSGVRYTANRCQVYFGSCTIHIRRNKLGTSWPCILHHRTVTGQYKRCVRYKADHHLSAYDTLKWDNFIFEYLLECLAKIKIVPARRGAVRGGTAGVGVAGGAFLNVRFICLGGVRGGGGTGYLCQRVGNFKLPVV